MYAFGELLKGFRQREGLTQRQLADNLGVHRNSISDWERSAYLPGTREMVLDLAQALSLNQADTDQLLRAAQYPAARDEQGTHDPTFPTPSPRTTFPIAETVTESLEVERSVFVAREDELAQLDRFLTDVLNDQQGRVVFVTGEAGSGKSALVQEFAARALAAHADLVVAGGNCNAYTGVGDPYLPFREIVGMLTGDRETRWAASATIREHANRLRTLFPHAVQALVNTGPDLIDTFIPGAALMTRAEAVATDNAQWLAQCRELVSRKAADPGQSNLEQRNLFAQYTGVLRKVARTQPLLLVLDDLQWADQGSIDLLSHLGAGLAGSPILILGAYRLADVALGRSGKRHPLAQVVNELRVQFGDIRIDLKQTAGRDFVNAIVDSEPNRLDAAFREALYQHTRGHALFTVEIVRSMQRRGDLVKNADGEWTVGETLDWNTFPARVEGVIEERINRLPESLQESLQVASVEGEDFLAEVAAHVQAMDAWAMVRQLSGTLDQRHRLVRGEVTQRLGAQRLSHYRFRHILFQQYLYNSLDNVVQPILHEKVGEVLEQLYAGQTEPVAVRLARHFQLAGIPEKAIVYLSQAGKRALRLSANAEAIGHFREVLALLETMPATPERDQQELEMQLGLGPALIALQGYAAPEVEQVYVRARELCEDGGDAPQLCRVLVGLWLIYFVRAELVEAHVLGEQLLQLAQRTQDPAVSLQAHRALSGPLCTMGEFTATQAHCEQGTAIYRAQPRQRRDALRYGQDPGVVYGAYSSLALWFLGHPDRALQQSQASLALADEVDHPFSRAFALGIAAMLHHLRREEQTVRAQAESALQLATEKEFIQWIVQGTILQGWAQVHQGQGAAQIAQMQQALDKWQSTGAKLLRPYFLLLLAEAHGVVGQAAAGLAVLDEALATVHTSGERWTEAELYRLRGELVLQAGNYGSESAVHSEAEACFQQAIDTARQQRAKTLELRAMLSLSRLWQTQGKRAAARTQLADVYAWFSEGFATPDLKAAEALLQELS